MLGAAGCWWSSGDDTSGFAGKLYYFCHSVSPTQSLVEVWVGVGSAPKSEEYIKVSCNAFPYSLPSGKSPASDLTCVKEALSLAPIHIADETQWHMQALRKEDPA